MTTRSFSGRAWRLAASTLVLSVGCNAAFDIEAGKPFPESCLLASDCPGSQICLFQVCSVQCHADQDCPDSGRCVQTGGDAACVAEGVGSCDSANPCPDGLSCVQSVCANACDGDDDCLGGQTCQLGVCAGANASEPLGAGGGGNSNGDGDAGPEACEDDSRRSCAEAGFLGDCAAGEQLCQDQAWQACSVVPQERDGCDLAGDDANCDGKPNGDCLCVRGETRACSEDGSRGNCALGLQHCLGDDGWSVCDVAAAESDSCSVRGDDASCDGIENDGCECLTGDERKCSEGKLFGACADGTQTCDAEGRWGACSIQPTADTCAPDNDNDCDGEQNEGCPCVEGTTRLCSKGGYEGTCAKGAQTCGASGEWGKCSIEATTDTCVLGNNDDCHDEPNEGCLCIEGVKRKCGPCKDGEQVCANGRLGAYTDCTGYTNKKTYFLDADQDGYGSSTSKTECEAPPGYVTNDYDCCDEDDRVHPGAEYSTIVDGGCGRGADINCSGEVEPKYAQTSCGEPFACASSGEVCPSPEFPGCGQPLTLCGCYYEPIYAECLIYQIPTYVQQMCH